MSTFSSYDISLHTKAGGCKGRWAYPCVLMRETMKDESVLECISLPYIILLLSYPTRSTKDWGWCNRLLKKVPIYEINYIIGHGIEKPIKWGQDEYNLNWSWCPKWGSPVNFIVSNQKQRFCDCNCTYLPFN